MLTKDVIKLQEKILKWLCKGKTGSIKYFFEIDNTDYLTEEYDLLIGDNYTIHRVKSTQWFLQLGDLDRMKIKENLFKLEGTVEIEMTDTLEALDKDMVRLFKLGEEKIWVNEKFLKDAGGADYLKQFKIKGTKPVAPIYFLNENGDVMHLMLPVNRTK